MSQIVEKRPFRNVEKSF